MSKSQKPCKKQKQVKQQTISQYSQDIFELPFDHEITLKISNLGETTVADLQELLKSILVAESETAEHRLDPEVDTSEIEEILTQALTAIKDRLMFLYLDGRCEDNKFQNLSKIIDDLYERFSPLDLPDLNEIGEFLEKGVLKNNDPSVH